MNKKYIISLFSTLLLSGICLPVLAQDDGKKKEEDLKRELTLEREFSPTVQDANKVNVLPEIKDPEVIKRNIEFSRFVLPAQPDKQITVLPSGRIMTDIEYNKKRGYLNFGIGNYMNINGDFGYHILSTATDQLNVFFTHRSTNGKVKYLKDYANSSLTKTKMKANDNTGGINYKHSFDNSVLKLGASYGYSSFNYYGYPFITPTMLNTEELQEIPVAPSLPDMESGISKNQVNQSFDAHLGLASKEHVEVGYQVDFGFTRFSQKYASYMLDPNSFYDGVKENHIYGTAGVYKPFHTDQRIGALAKVNYFTYGEPKYISEDKQKSFNNYMELTLSPYYQIDADIWNLRLGANVMFITGKYDKIFVSPNISAQINAGEKARVYLNATGDIRSNDFRTISLENRYISTYVRPIPSKTMLDATLGVKANLGAGAWMNVYAGYRMTNDELFYATNFTDKVMNDVSAFQRDARVFKIGASFQYNYLNIVELGIRGEYKNWNVKGDINYTLAPATPGAEGEARSFSDLKAYGKPSFELDMNIRFRPIEQLTIDINHYTGTGRQALLRFANHEPKNVKMDAIHDLSVMATWKINNTFSVFAKANNLLFQKYDLFYGHPSQGMSLMAGFNINF